MMTAHEGRLRKEIHPIHDPIHPPLTYFKNLFNINNNSFFWCMLAKRSIFLWSLCKTDSKRIFKENRRDKLNLKIKANYTLIQLYKLYIKHITD